MFRSYRIGSLFGFSIALNLSFLLMLGLILLWAGLGPGLVFVAVAAGSVLLHELGHALVARWLRLPVAGIELHFFGGIASMGQPRSARDEIAVSAAGPVVSLGLGLVGIALHSLTGWVGFFAVGWFNLLIAGFNMIPALPMDGGRIFRALLSHRMGFKRATVLAVWVARALAIALALYGIATLRVYPVVLAVLLWSMGTAELRQAERSGYRAEPSRAEPLRPEVMPRGFRPGNAVAPGSFVIVRRGGRVVIEYRD